jgi:hypothetical protein
MRSRATRRRTRDRNKINPLSSEAAMKGDSWHPPAGQSQLRPLGFEEAQLSMVAASENDRRSSTSVVSSEHGACDV